MTASDQPESPSRSRSDDFWTGWWTFIGGPAFMIWGVHDLIFGPGWWEYLRGAVFFLVGAVLWSHHAKVIYRHIKRS